MIALLFAIALTAGPTDPSTWREASSAELRPAMAMTETTAEAEAPVLAGVAVTVECTARASGKVDACVVLGETHPGLGFGDAAVALVQDSRVEPGQSDVRFARTIQFTP
jgi:TonB family protein